MSVATLASLRLLGYNALAVLDRRQQALSFSCGRRIWQQGDTMPVRQDCVKLVRETLSLPSEKLPRPALILLSGLPGTGKSHLAQRLAQRLPLLVVSSDQVRRLLFHDPQYTGDEHYVVHGTCQDVIAEILQAGYSIICDATNLLCRHRQSYYALAETYQARLLILQTMASPQVVRERLLRRQANLLSPPSSDADWEVYQRYSQKMEPIRRAHRIVDAAEPRLVDGGQVHSGRVGTNINRPCSYIV